jgi:hypothetical protein
LSQAETLIHRSGFMSSDQPSSRRHVARGSFGGEPNEQMQWTSVFVAIHYLRGSRWSEWSIFMLCRNVECWSRPGFGMVL